MAVAFIGIRIEGSLSEVREKAESLIRELTSRSEVISASIEISSEPAAVQTDAEAAPRTKFQLTAAMRKIAEAILLINSQDAARLYSYQIKKVSGLRPDVTSRVIKRMKELGWLRVFAETSGAPLYPHPRVIYIITPAGEVALKAVAQGKRPPA